MLGVNESKDRLRSDICSHRCLLSSSSLTRCCSLIRGISATASRRLYQLIIVVVDVRPVLICCSTTLLLIIKHLYLVVIKFWVKSRIGGRVLCDKPLRALPYRFYLLELLLLILRSVYLIELIGDWFTGNSLREVK